MGNGKVVLLVLVVVVSALSLCSFLKLISVDEPNHNLIAAAIVSSLPPQEVLTGNSDNSPPKEHANCHGSSHSLSAQEQQGTWMGNWWIPPTGWKLFTPTQIRDTLKQSSVLWIGDSTARRASATLFHLMKHHNHTEELGRKEMNPKSQLNINKHSVEEACLKWDANTTTHHPHYCFTMPETENDYIYVAKSCFREIPLFLEDELAGISNITAHVNVMIVSLGIWHVVQPKRCQDHSNTTSWIDQALASLYKFQHARPNMKIIWRTTNFSPKHDHDKSQEINTYAMAHIDQQYNHHHDDHRANSGENIVGKIMYIDWGGAVRSRTTGKDRIPADIPPHTGLEARLVLSQMITNVLHQEEQRTAACP